MNILYNITGLDVANAQVTSYDNWLPLDRSPELLFSSHIAGELIQLTNLDVKTPWIITTDHRDSFSAQFLTWSFSAPISCLVLNGFHSCFLKPKSLAGVACYRSPYKVKSVRLWRHLTSQWNLHSTMNRKEENSSENCTRPWVTGIILLCILMSLI